MGSGHRLLETIPFPYTPRLDEMNISETCPGIRLFSGRLQAVSSSKEGEKVKCFSFFKQASLGHIQRTTSTDQGFKPLLLNVIILFPYRVYVLNHIPAGVR